MEMLRRIRLATRGIAPESFLWIEGMNDAYGQYLDYFMDKNPVWEPMRAHPEMETFVEMWRYTMPTYVTANDPGVYSYPPSKDWVYAPDYNFVLGIRGITSGPGRAEAGIRPYPGTAAEEAKHKAVVEKIERLWAKGGQFFFYGRFMDDIGLRVSNPDVLAKAYLCETGVAVPMWNTTDGPTTVDVAIDLRALSKPDAKVMEAVNLDGDEHIPYRMGGSTVRAQVKLAPKDIAVIAVRTKR
jgi:hypothetical protein